MVQPLSESGNVFLIAKIFICEIEVKILFHKQEKKKGQKNAMLRDSWAARSVKFRVLILAPVMISGL